MPLTPLDSNLYGSSWSDARVAALHADERQVQFLLEVEAALARAQGKLGVIPAEAADAIDRGTRTLEADFAALRAGIEHDGFPIIALVRQLRDHVGGDAANFVHWGATTQDIVDTANVLQARAALEFITANLERLISRLAHLADQHRGTLMAGRTHTQHALPITFGLKAAGWLAPLLRHLERQREWQPRVFSVQFGGAVGTLASLGSRGLEVQAGLARELGLHTPVMPWHTQRDAWAELAAWLSMLTGSLAKMAQDVLLLAQSEIAEVRESGDRSRGGSSAMPQKSNPIISEQVLAAARVNASLLASVHQAMPQEHERGTHGWQMEWLALPQMLGLTSGALEKTVFLAENLVVDADRMLEHVRKSRGLMLAEQVTFALAAHLPRAEAKALVRAAVQEALETQRHLIEVVREQTNAALEWDKLTEQHTLGSSDALIDRVLTEAERVLQHA